MSSLSIRILGEVGEKESVADVQVDEATCRSLMFSAEMDGTDFPRPEVISVTRSDSLWESCTPKPGPSNDRRSPRHLVPASMHSMVQSSLSSLDSIGHHALERRKPQRQHKNDLTLAKAPLHPLRSHSTSRDTSMIMPPQPSCTMFHTKIVALRNLRQRWPPRLGKGASRRLSSSGMSPFREGITSRPSLTTIGSIVPIRFSVVVSLFEALHTYGLAIPLFSSLGNLPLASLGTSLSTNTACFCLVGAISSRRNSRTNKLQAINNIFPFQPCVPYPIDQWRRPLLLSDDVEVE